MVFDENCEDRTERRPIDKVGEQASESWNLLRFAHKDCYFSPTSRRSAHCRPTDPRRRCEA